LIVIYLCGEMYKLWCSSLRIFLHILPCHRSSVKIFFSNAFILCSSLNIRDEVSYS
jgi:hypothetical protein